MQERPALRSGLSMLNAPLYYYTIPIVNPDLCRNKIASHELLDSGKLRIDDEMYLSGRPIGLVDKRYYGGSASR